jgi:hypothetical protein
MVLARHKSGYGSLTFRNCTSRSTGLILGQAITSIFGSRRASDPRQICESCTVSEDDTPPDPRPSDESCTVSEAEPVPWHLIPRHTNKKIYSFGRTVR